ncbi:ubiquitin carboxyl-terminal hydrolase 24-like [Impatiens glandulifera]|uniref:ubiquitin carboxyl-terminal hydrolase 24-like n=1 Tax=Impatiens glandulifera TaxID=253017 RepID=UPI001FB0DB71|nr:ubiquitin carboxyl-terminal hydrolase 24-like [Impatiens glandulifera]
MSNSKVFLFGTFTEDETKSWVNQSSGITAKQEGKKTLSVPALNSPTVPNHVVAKQPGVIDSQSSTIAFESSKNSKAEHLKEVKDLPERPFKIPAGNGILHSSSHSISTCNGRKEPTILEGIDMDSLHITDINQGSLKIPICSEEHTMNGDVVQESNGRFNGPSITLKTGVLLASDGLNTAVRDIRPRGLINSGNLCFFNATLQALLSCSPFVQLLQGLRNHNISKVNYPTIAAFAEFIAEFDFPCGVKANQKNTLETGRPFSPTTFEGVLKKFTPDVPNSISGRPRQEDAQELLSFIMHQMHEELLKFEGQRLNLNGAKSSLVSYAEDDEWETVGPKNKSAVTRTQDLDPSELSAIFGGQLRSVVEAKGNKASATIQPFLLLHLDISHAAVHTIEDALRLFSAPEMLDEYRTSITGKDGVVTARKSLSIQTLPKIMILHLMRFSFGHNGATKLNKPVRFPIQMELGRKLLVSPSTQGRRYELVSTISHHGRESSKGHYTTDARYPDGVWLRFDDASVITVDLKKVLHGQAYILFYRQVL